MESRTLDPASGRFDWDGTLANGSRAPDGAYTLALTALDALGNPISTTVGGVGTVQSVSLLENDVSLTINGVAQDARALTNIG